MTTLRVTAPPAGWAPPWPVVIEIASALPPRSWVLVGGLMVQLHARVAGVEEVRPTLDVDALIDVMAAGVSMAGITGALTARGFDVVEPGWPESPVHRLRRDDPQGPRRRRARRARVSAAPPPARCRGQRRPSRRPPAGAGRASAGGLR